MPGRVQKTGRLEGVRIRKKGRVAMADVKRHDDISSSRYGVVLYGHALISRLNEKVAIYDVITGMWQLISVVQPVRYFHRLWLQSKKCSPDPDIKVNEYKLNFFCFWFLFSSGFDCHLLSVVEPVRFWPALSIFFASSDSSSGSSF